MAVDMFLKIDGIPGETADHKHKGEIEILSWSWGISQTASGGGGGAGKVSVSDFSFIKKIDAASPKLMEACCTGEHIRDATLTFVSKETRQEYFKIKLQDCLISSFQMGGGGGGGALPADQVSLNFTNVDMQAADNKGQFVQVSCNFTKNTDGQIGHDH